MHICRSLSVSARSSENYTVVHFWNSPPSAHWGKVTSFRCRSCFAFIIVGWFHNGVWSLYLCPYLSLVFMSCVVLFPLSTGFSKRMLPPFLTIALAISTERSTRRLAFSSSVCWRGVRWLSPLGLVLSRIGPGASIPFDPILACH